uniref:Uncharacterized protein n=1 Tax=Rhizophora mucronata TaxID=61149 RepID=A0A2P2QWZ7_RHIMU
MLVSKSGNLAVDTFNNSSTVFCPVFSMGSTLAAHFYFPCSTECLPSPGFQGQVPLTAATVISFRRPQSESADHWWIQILNAASQHWWKPRRVGSRRTASEERTQL